MFVDERWRLVAIRVKFVIGILGLAIQVQQQPTRAANEDRLQEFDADPSVRADPEVWGTGVVLSGEK